MAPKYTLTYFELSGLAEPIRLLFKYGNIDFIDKRISQDDWLPIKSETPLGKLPILEEDGKVLHQHLAICRYVANLVGLAGENSLENYEIDSAVDSIADTRSGVIQCVFEQNQEKKQALFKKLEEETLPYFLTRLEQLVQKNKGYFANSKMSWADFYFFSTFDFLKDGKYVGKDLITDEYPNLQGVKKKVADLPAISKWIMTRPPNKFDPERVIRQMSK